MTDEQIGQAIKIARVSAGMSQEDIARKVGVSQPLISSAERGKFSDLGPETLAKIKEAVGLTPELEGLLDKVARLNAAQLDRFIELIHEEDEHYGQSLRCCAEQAQPGCDPVRAGAIDPAPAGEIGG